ncbi:hypothetical protein RND81_10G093200 [Saponaria officinalis]|uniref:GRF-type domain-containing protein n=1 Tax=Saponaria officinalis TaxID=3572 RepID=A0AAW1I2M7_SAPOF
MVIFDQIFFPYFSLVHQTMKKDNLSSSSSSISNSQNVRNHFLCRHQVPTILRTVKKGIQVGKRFHGCSFWPNNGCGFFKLEDEVLDESGLQMNFLEMKRLFEEKVDKLKLKNKKLKEEVMTSRFETRNRKN